MRVDLQSAEQWLRAAVSALMLAVESAAAVIIFAGAAIAFFGFAVHALRRGGTDAFVKVRLRLGRYLALGLEFQLAADLLRTAIAPSFEEIGKLAAIAAIRTGLNYFLEREIAQERAELEERRSE